MVTEASLFDGYQFYQFFTITKSCNLNFKLLRLSLIINLAGIPKSILVGNPLAITCLDVDYIERFKFQIYSAANNLTDTNESFVSVLIN